MEETKISKLSPYLMPIAVVIAGGLIAGAVLLNGSTEKVTQQKNTNPTAQNVPEQQVGSTDAVAKVTDKDHIKGNPDALVKIVEYSDFECPFCKQFHNTMNEIMEQVARWHGYLDSFPLTNYIQ